jgi:hypothetical protein
VNIGLSSARGMKAAGASGIEGPRPRLLFSRISSVVEITELERDARTITSKCAKQTIVSRIFRNSEKANVMILSVTKITTDVIPETNPEYPPEHP